jgi:hypothetical protein
MFSSLPVHLQFSNAYVHRGIIDPLLDDQDPSAYLLEILPPLTGDASRATSLLDFLKRGLFFQFDKTMQEGKLYRAVTFVCCFVTEHHCGCFCVGDSDPRTRNLSDTINGMSFVQRLNHIATCVSVKECDHEQLLYDVQACGVGSGVVCPPVSGREKGQYICHPDTESLLQGILTGGAFKFSLFLLCRVDRSPRFIPGCQGALWLVDVLVVWWPGKVDLAWPSLPFGTELKVMLCKAEKPVRQAAEDRVDNPEGTEVGSAVSAAEPSAPLQMSDANWLWDRYKYQAIAQVHHSCAPMADLVTAVL